MNWRNLKENKCPNCGIELSMSLNLQTDRFECPCGFKINQNKFKLIVSDLVHEEMEGIII
jgi:DNA-directed RNA polymerase subunit RPC12/RpoP